MAWQTGAEQTISCQRFKDHAATQNCQAWQGISTECFVILRCILDHDLHHFSCRLQQQSEASHVIICRAFFSNHQWLRQLLYALWADRSCQTKTTPGVALGECLLRDGEWQQRPCSFVGTQSTGRFVVDCRSGLVLTAGTGALLASALCWVAAAHSWLRLTSGINRWHKPWRCQHWSRAPMRPPIMQTKKTIRAVTGLLRWRTRNSTSHR